MSSRVSQRLVASLLFLACLVTGLAQAAPPQRWTFIDLHSLGAYSSAADVNNRGDVIGSSWVPSTVSHHPWIWQNGMLTDLAGSLPANSTVYRIGDRGTMLGTVNQHPHIFSDGTVTSLPIDYAYDMNRFEHVAGFVRIFIGGWQGYGARAVVYRDGVVQDLGTLGGQQSAAYAINDRGVVVGYSHVAMGSSVGHAFRYENGVMTDLGTLGGAESFAKAVNSHGVIVGTAQEASGRQVAVMWDRAGIRRLVDGNSRAVDINDRGQVVLMGTVNGVNGTYLYDEGTITHLDSLPEVRAAGVARLEATAINDRGWIAGFANRPGQEMKAFLLIPR